MIVSGIDVGGENVRVIIMNDGEILAKGETATGIKKAEATEQLYDQTLKKVNLRRKDIGRVVATGSASKRVAFADGEIPDATADARGINMLVPSARTIIDIGAEEGRAIKISPEGRVLDFAINEKCAAGSGAFIEAMSRALETPIGEMGPLANKSDREIHLNAQCAIFAESEVVGLIHAQTEKKDISKAIHDAIASRMVSLIRRIGVNEDVVLIGGVARNPGFVNAVKKQLGLEKLYIPDDPEYGMAVGAAVVAAEE